MTKIVEPESAWGPEQLGRRLGIKKSTIYSHLSRGTSLPPYFRVGSQTRWRPEDVEKWIEGQLKERRKESFGD